MEQIKALLNEVIHSCSELPNVQLAEEHEPILKKAQTLIAMLECFVLELGRIDTVDKLIRPQDIDILFEAFPRILRSQNLAIDYFCNRNEELLMQIIARWQGDVSPLVDAILPYGHWGSRRYDGPNAFALHQRLSAAILPRLAAQVIAGLRDSGYVHRVWTHDKGTSQIRCLLLAHEGPLWKDARNELLACINGAGSSQVIQENVYELLLWFEHGLGERAVTGDAESLKKLFQDKGLLDSIWAAATAKQLSPYATIRLNNFVLSLKKFGFTVSLPSWWENSIKQLVLPKAENQALGNEPVQKT